MLAVYGTALIFAGLVIFFGLLRLHRRPTSSHWLSRGGVGETVIFICMMISLYGLALIGQFGVDATAVFDTLISAEMLGVTAVGIVLLKLLYVPLPKTDAPA